MQNRDITERKEGLCANTQSPGWSTLKTNSAGDDGDTCEACRCRGLRFRRPLRYLSARLFSSLAMAPRPAPAVVVPATVTAMKCRAVELQNQHRFTPLP